MSTDKEVKALIEEKKGDPGVMHIAMLRYLVERQAGRNAVKGLANSMRAPLDAEEQQLLAMIEKHLRQRLAGSGLTQQQTNDMINYCTEPCGPRTVIDLFTRDVTVYGVPFRYYWIVAALGLGAFIMTSNFALVLLGVPVIHGLLFLLCAKSTKERYRLRKEKILSGAQINGLPIDL